MEGCTWTPAQLIKIDNRGIGILKNFLGTHNIIMSPRLKGSATRDLTILRGKRKGYNIVDDKIQTTRIRTDEMIDPDTNKVITTSLLYDLQFKDL